MSVVVSLIQIAHFAAAAAVVAGCCVSQVLVVSRVEALEAMGEKSAAVTALLPFDPLQDTNLDVLVALEKSSDLLAS